MLIEKNIPIPSKRPNDEKGITTWLRQMDIGDSVFYSFSAYGKGVKNTLNKIVYGRLRANGKAFRMRAGLDGVRVWRIS